MADEVSFSRVVPSGIAKPVELLDKGAQASRDEYVLDHGLTRSGIAHEWWTSREIEIRFPSNVGGKERLTRRDLFELGQKADSGDEILDFVWHVLAWGSGRRNRNNLKRITSCTDQIDLLREAIEAARAGDARAAYSTLVRGRAIPYLGPAFFTKILYFASGSDDPRCLILDARVARSLYRLGWSISPTYPSRNFSYRWYTDTCESYCETLTEWAAERASASGPLRADVLERLLFERGR